MVLHQYEAPVRPLGGFLSVGTLSTLAVWACQIDSRRLVVVEVPVVDTDLYSGVAHPVLNLTAAQATLMVVSSLVGTTNLPP